jgi:K+-sensing histidine kinase KdpD
MRSCQRASRGATKRDCRILSGLWSEDPLDPFLSNRGVFGSFQVSSPMNRSTANAAAMSKKNAGDNLTAEDISARIAALEDEIRTLQQLAEYRSRVISRVAHELRTPLTSILGFSEILLGQEQLTSAQQNFCRRIQSSAQQLQNTLNQLSELARLQGGKADLYIEEFALEDLLAETTRLLVPDLKKHGVGVHWKASLDLPLIASDRGRLRQILRILVDYEITRRRIEDRINLVASKIAHGALITIVAEGASAEDDGSVSQNDLALTVARYNLGLLGATLSIQQSESKNFTLAIQLPLQPPPEHT